MNHELLKIEKFYQSQETGLLANYNQLKDDITEFNNNLHKNRTPSFADVLPKVSSISQDENLDNNNNIEGDDLESINSPASMSLEPIPIQE